MKTPKTPKTPAAPSTPAPSAPVPPPSPAPLPPPAVIAPEGAGLPLISKSGKEIGRRFLMGAKTAKELREAGKAAGLRGDKLTEYVNSFLSGDEIAMRNAATAATLSALVAEGYVGDVADKRKNSAIIRMVRPSSPKVDADADKLAKAEAEVEELRAKLNALLAKA